MSKVIQIAVSTLNAAEGYACQVVALCDDGTMWMHDAYSWPREGYRPWKRLPAVDEPALKYDAGVDEGEVVTNDPAATSYSCMLCGVNHPIVEGRVVHTVF